MFPRVPNAGAGSAGTDGGGITALPSQEGIRGEPVDSQSHPRPAGRRKPCLGWHCSCRREPGSLWPGDDDTASLSPRQVVSEAGG